MLCTTYKVNLWQHAVLCCLTVDHRPFSIQSMPSSDTHTWEISQVHKNTSKEKNKMNLKPSLCVSAIYQCVCEWVNFAYRGKCFDWLISLEKLFHSLFSPLSSFHFFRLIWSVYFVCCPISSVYVLCKVSTSWYSCFRHFYLAH